MCGGGGVGGGGPSYISAFQVGDGGGGSRPIFLVILLYEFKKTRLAHAFFISIEWLILSNFDV